MTRSRDLWVALLLLQAWPLPTYGLQVAVTKLGLGPSLLLPRVEAVCVFIAEPSDPDWAPATHRGSAVTCRMNEFMSRSTFHLIFGQEC